MNFQFRVYSVFILQVLKSLPLESKLYPIFFGTSFWKISKWPTLAMIESLGSFVLVHALLLRSDVAAGLCRCFNGCKQYHSINPTSWHTEP